MIEPAYAIKHSRFRFIAFLLREPKTDKPKFGRKRNVSRKQQHTVKFTFKRVRFAISLRPRRRNYFLK